MDLRNQDMRCKQNYFDASPHLVGRYSILQQSKKEEQLSFVAKANP
jgi:hypothetical protein